MEFDILGDLPKSFISDFGLEGGKILYSTVKYIFLSDKIRNKAILTGYGRDRSQESF